MLNITKSRLIEQQNNCTETHGLVKTRLGT